MNQEQIKTLIDALAASDLAELEYSENGSTLRLVKQSALDNPPLARSVRRAPAVTPLEGEGEGPAASDNAPLNEPPIAQPGLPAECLAPLYGVIHLQPSPGEPSFVQPGQAVAAGQTLCVIEAMKVFNEVRAEADLTVQAVLVRSGDEVEAGQPLFRFG